MVISPDQIIYFEWGFLKINATLLWTWVVMAGLVLVSWLVTRNLTSEADISKLQNLLEVLVGYARDQVRQIGRKKSETYLPFVASLFIFIAVSNLLSVVPGYHPPTGSLSTTSALAACVFVAIPVFGIQAGGVKNYFRQYIQPSPLMLPFNILGELSRTLALAVRLFGNVMSGSKIAAILLAVIPLVFPVVMQLLGLLTGFIQAYIFAILATVYIAAGIRARERKGETENG